MPLAQLKSAVVQLTACVTGNKPGQALIGRLVSWLQLLQGVGSGCSVELSGEKGVLRQLAGRANGRTVMVFDVGANQGQFLRAVRSVFGGAPYSIHSFEPGMGAFRTLSAEFGRFDNVMLNHQAVSDRSGTATLWFDAPGSAGASLVRRDLSHVGREFSSEESVPTVTIDEYCHANRIEYIDLLKIDVEGHELEVLKGASRALESGRIGMVLFEFGGCNVDSRSFLRDFWRLFSSVDMRLGRLTPSGYVVPLSRYSEALEQFRTANYVATRS